MFGCIIYDDRILFAYAYAPGFFDELFELWVVSLSMNELPESVGFS